MLCCSENVWQRDGVCVCVCLSQKYLVCVCVFMMMKMKPTWLTEVFLIVVDIFQAKEISLHVAFHSPVDTEAVCVCVCVCVCVLKDATAYD